MHLDHYRHEDERAVTSAEPIPWTVQVVSRGRGQATVFSVGVQSFELARDEDGSEPGHCEFIADMFLHAMNAAGAPPPTRDSCACL